MPHFSIKKENIKGEIINIQDVLLLKHLVSSMRVKPSEMVKFIDEDEIVYETEILSVSKKSIEGKIKKQYKSERKLSANINLALSILKGDGMSFAISNSTQSGIKKLYLSISDNCAIRNIKNLEKLQKISDESFKQCERADKMEVVEPKKLKEILKDFKNVIVFAEKFSNTSLKDALKNYDKKEELLVVIGPEGGFSKEEFDYFKKQNYPLVSLGKLIYKAPNAVVAGISNIIYELGL